MNVFEQALVARLTGTTALTTLLATPTSVFNHVAPSSAALDYVVVQLNAGGPVNRSPRRSETLVYLVKAVSGVGVTRAGEIDDQIDAALHARPLGVPGWSNYWLTRDGRVRFDEVDGGGRVYWHAGGFYRARLAV